LAKDQRIVPVIGARTRVQLGEALAGVELGLAPDEVASLEAAVPASAVAGTRYDPHQMRTLDSKP
jgi:aryl-alcohol dehydrogenase-like predicted oxidoreductase